MIALARDPKPLPGGGWGFWLPAADVEPRDDPAWPLASPAMRRRFWQEARSVAAKVWDDARARGLDRHGRPLKEIGPATKKARKDDVNRVTARQPYSPMGRAKVANKPLTPVGRKSRTRALLRHRFVEGEGGWFYWLKDEHTGRYWGEIVARHAQGFVQWMRYPGPPRPVTVPARDVMGFSEGELAKVRSHMASWWAARRRTAEVLFAARTAEVPSKAPEYGWVEIPPGPVTGGPGMRPGPRPGGEPGSRPRPGGAPGPRQAAAPKRSRLGAAVGVLGGAVRTAAEWAGLLASADWRTVRWTALWIALLEFVRLADWGEVRDLFGRLGLREPADRDDAREILLARAGGGDGGAP